HTRFCVSYTQFLGLAQALGGKPEVQVPDAVGRTSATVQDSRGKIQGGGAEGGEPDGRKGPASQGERWHTARRGAERWATERGVGRRCRAAPKPRPRLGVAGAPAPRTQARTQPRAHRQCGDRTRRRRGAYRAVDEPARREARLHGDVALPVCLGQGRAAHAHGRRRRWSTDPGPREHGRGTARLAYGPRTVLATAAPAVAQAPVDCRDPADGPTDHPEPGRLGGVRTAFDGRDRAR